MPQKETGNMVKHPNPTAHLLITSSSEIQREFDVVHLVWRSRASHVHVNISSSFFADSVGDTFYKSGNKYYTTGSYMTAMRSYTAALECWPNALGFDPHPRHKTLVLRGNMRNQRRHASPTLVSFFKISTSAVQYTIAFTLPSPQMWECFRVPTDFSRVDCSGCLQPACKPPETTTLTWQTRSMGWAMRATLWESLARRCSITKRRWRSDTRREGQSGDAILAFSLVFPLSEAVFYFKYHIDLLAFQSNLNIAVITQRSHTFFSVPFAPQGCLISRRRGAWRGVLNHVIHMIAYAIA